MRVAAPHRLLRSPRWTSTSALLLALVGTAALAQAGETSLPAGTAATPDAPAAVDAPAAQATLVPEPAATANVDVMRAAMTTYFRKEQRTGLFASGLGLASLGTGIGLFAWGGAARQGVAVPLMVMGAAQLAIGIALSVRTPPQLTRLDAQLTDAPATYAAEERARMHRVNSRWWLYRAVEVSVAFSGIFVAGAGGVAQNDAAVGVGFALVGEALVMLLIDHFAEARAHDYEAALLGFRF